MKYTATTIGLIFLAIPSYLVADPWVYEQGEQSFSVIYVGETFDQVWIMGDVSMDFADVDQRTVWVQYSRGLTDTVTLDVSAGFTESTMAGNAKEYSGLADSKVGINWQLYNEYQGFPVTLSVSFAATLRGTYDRSSAGQPHGPGDKANALETSVSVAKGFGRIAAVGEFGYRARFNDVPDEIFYSIGLTGSITPSLSLGARYRVMDSRGDLDIMGTGFTPDRFHETEEDYDGYSIDATWSFGYGHSINAGIASVLEGTNTGNSDIYYVGYSHSF